MSKFKVGDKVVGNAKASKRYVITGTGYGATVTRLTARGEIQLNDVWFVDPECFDLIKSVNPTTYELHITCNDGKTTNAVYKVNGKIEKRTQAICAPSDTFDFATGVLTSIDRMFLKTEPVAQPAQDKPKFEVGQKVKIVSARLSHKAHDIGKVYEITNIYPDGIAMWREPVYEVGNDYIWFEDELEPYVEPEPKYLNMKVVCVEYPVPYKSFIVGKIYEFRNGIIVDECKDVYNECNPCETLKEFNKSRIPQFIEFKG